MKPGHRRFFQAAATGLGLVAGAVATLAIAPAASRAESLCYLIDSSGREISLESLCQGSSPGAPPQGPDLGPASETTAPASPRVRRYRIIGSPAPTPAAPSQTGGTAPAVAPPASSGNGPGNGENTTTVQVLEGPNGSITIIDRPDRQVGDITIPGRDQVIVQPGPPGGGASPAGGGR